LQARPLVHLHSTQPQRSAVLQGKAYDAKADIWSAGCILHELAGLKKTFEAPSLATMYSRIME
jgi:serine/threonine protein kinase